MSLSLNEIEGSAYKAARGAGFAWGLAEEAAFGAGWLAARGFDWLPAFLDVCEARLAHAGDGVRIDGRRVSPGAAAQSLCPILVGAWIADRSEIADGLEIAALRQPLLILPFLDLLSLRCGPISLTLLPAAGGTAQKYEVCRGTLLADPQHPTMPALARAEVRAGETRAPVDNIDVLARPSALDPTLCARLRALEARTYVPASQHSRLAGAGAGLTDND